MGARQEGPRSHLSSGLPHLSVSALHHPHSGEEIGMKIQEHVNLEDWLQEPIVFVGTSVQPAYGH